MPSLLQQGGLREAAVPVMDRLGAGTARAVPVLLGVFIILIPFSQDTSVKEICFYASTGLCALSMGAGRLRISFTAPVAPPFAAFIIWVILAAPFTLNLPNTVNDIWAHLVKYLIYAAMVAHFFAGRRRFVVLTWLVIASATLYVAWYVAYFYVFLGNPWGSRLILFPYRDYIYVFALLLAGGHLFGGHSPAVRAAAGAAMAVQIAAAVLSQSRSTLLAMLVGLFVLCPKKKLTLLIAAAVMIVAVAVDSPLGRRFTQETTLMNDRLTTNWVSLLVVRDHPVFGIGFGMQTYGLPAFVDLEKYHEMVPERYRWPLILRAPHNLLADVAVRTGVVGLGLYLWMLAAFARMLMRRMQASPDAFAGRWAGCSAACLSAYLAQAMFGDATYDLQALVFYTNLAMGVILWRMTPADQVSPATTNFGTP